MTPTPPPMTAPVPDLVAEALEQTAATRRPVYAQDLAEYLADRGPAAWQEAAITATREVARAMGIRRPDPVGAELFRSVMEQNDSASAPSENAGLEMVAAWMAGGEDQARHMLETLDAATVEGATLWLVIMYAAGDFTGEGDRPPDPRIRAEHEELWEAVMRPIVEREGGRRQ